MPQYRIEIPALIESLRIAAPFTTAVLNELPEGPERDRLTHDLALVASEALTNAIRHSKHPEDPVSISFSIAPGEITITVTDSGKGFDLEEVSLPDFDTHPEGGYGIFIMKSLMDDVSYEKSPEGNHLVLVKRCEVQE